MRSTAAPENRIWINVNLPFDSVLRIPNGGPAKQIIVLLHGYAESGERIFARLEEALPADSVILAPNAPFPIPERKSNGEYRIGFSWYFFNSPTNEYFIDMSVAIAAIKNAINALGLSVPLPVRIIGFSQGGYLAPFLARELGHAAQVIGIGSEYLTDDLIQAELTKDSGLKQMRLDSVHGVKDELVSHGKAQASFNSLKAAGFNCRDFITLPEETHLITPIVREAVGELLACALGGL
jgi:predicted esterase